MNFRRGFFEKNWRKAIVYSVLSALVIWFVYTTVTFPEYNKFRYEHFRLSDGVVLDRNYYPLSVVRQDFDIRRAGYVRLSEVSNRFLSLLIQSEDKRFYSHPGIDFISLASSLRDFFLGKKLRGASTINMQFARNYFRFTQDNGILRKIREMIYAVIIDIRWSKNEILEAYINTVPLRGEISGIYTASWG
ncbi:MAG: transglycosylase domain-containing protein, partial [Deltaproteobacteria bacterium]|nr:transglycosylase domain-containing protein [Deltaproteobacteria bacterium]